MDYLCGESSTAHGVSSENVEGAELGLELRRLWHVIMHGVVRPPELEGLQRQQFWVLGALAGRPRRMSDLAECSQISQTSLTGIVDRLEERGLVCRTRSDSDRRVVEVDLTVEGRATMEAANAEYFSRVNAVLEPLDPSERELLLSLVRKLTACRPGHNR